MPTPSEREIKTVNPLTCTEDELALQFKGINITPIDLPDLKDMDAFDKILRVIVRTKITPIFYLSKYDDNDLALIQIPDAKAIFLAACKKGMLALLLRQVELGITPTRPVNDAANDMANIAVGQFKCITNGKAVFSVDTKVREHLFNESSTAFAKLCGDLINKPSIPNISS